MIDVFVSRPHFIEQSFQAGLENFLRFLKSLDLNPRTLGTTDYPTEPPLDEIIQLMDQCSGAVILGYPQITVTAGSIKNAPLRAELILPTEWNQIEATVAYSRHLPLLLINHPGVKRGTFERGSLSAYIHETNLKNADWPLAENISGAIQRWKQHMMMTPPTVTKVGNAHVTTTDDVYEAYSSLGPDDDLLAWVATWPPFWGTEKEKALQNCRAKRIVVAGPLDLISHLPGIFWRLEIQESRAAGSSPLFLFIKNLPTPKMIIAGRRVFYAPIPEGRTTIYFEVGHASDDLITGFLAGLEGARPVEEAVYTFLLRRLNESGKSALDSSYLIQALEDEAAMDGVTPDDLRYDTHMVRPLIQKWVPKCVNWTEKFRGWNALNMRLQKNDFSLRLRHNGQCLPRQHADYLQELETPIVVWPKRKICVVPRIRIVATNRCDLGCNYCPPENEDYAGGAGRNSLLPEELSLVLKAATSCGFSDFSVTGGEPLSPAIIGDSLVAELLKLYPTVISDRTKVAIQTNGRHLAQYIDRLSPIRASITLKVSLDAIVLSDKIAKSRVAKDVLDGIHRAKEAGFQIGVNFVLTKDTAPQLVQVATWCYEKKVYLKILDLNWYYDIGRRGEGLGSRQGFASADLYWAEQYLSPLQVYNEQLQSRFGELRRVSTRFGIPMFETDPDPGGFFIRIKDSAIGSHYSKECRVCPFFVQRRRCQEGVYQLWITPGLRLKLCRHRPDINEDLNNAVNSGDVERVANVMRTMLERFYKDTSFVQLHSV